MFKVLPVLLLLALCQHSVVDTGGLVHSTDHHSRPGHETSHLINILIWGIYNVFRDNFTLKFCLKNSLTKFISESHVHCLASSSFYESCSVYQKVCVIQGRVRGCPYAHSIPKMSILFWLLKWFLWFYGIVTVVHYEMDHLWGKKKPTNKTKTKNKTKQKRSSEITFK